MAASVHWTMTILNFNRTLENLRTMDAFNSTSFLVTDWRDPLWKAPVIAVSQNCLKELLSESLTDKFH